MGRTHYFERRRLDAAVGAYDELYQYGAADTRLYRFGRVAYLLHEPLPERLDIAAEEGRHLLDIVIHFVRLPVFELDDDHAVARVAQMLVLAQRVRVFQYRHRLDAAGVYRRQIVDRLAVDYAEELLRLRRGSLAAAILYYECVGRHPLRLGRSRVSAAPPLDNDDFRFGLLCRGGRERHGCCCDGDQNSQCFHNRVDLGFLLLQSYAIFVLRRSDAG